MRKQILLVMLLCGSVGMDLVAGAQSSSPIVIVGPSIVEDECDTQSSEFYAVLNSYPNGPNQMWFDPCVVIAYPSGSTITQQRAVITASGNVVFQFFVALADHGSALHSTYTVTVTADDTHKLSPSVTNTGTVKLFGSLAIDAPAGAAAAHMQATATSPLAFATLNIPLPLASAESVVTFKFSLSQGQGSVDPIQENSPNDDTQVTSVLGPWTDQGSYPGPDLSKVLPVTDPTSMAADQFVSIVTPAAQFQLPVLPVAILYAPLGNATGTNQAKSLYGVTQITGTNLQTVSSQGTTTSMTRDQKSSYSADLTLSGLLGKKGDNSDGSSGSDGTSGSLGFTVSGSWDSSQTSDNTNSSSTTATFITGDQFGMQWLNPASTTLPLPQVTYATQPFWSDVFIVALNTQFSAWDYPDSPVLQPMGNVQLIPIPLMQMVNCAATPNATQTSTPNPSNIDHFVSFAPVGGGANVYIWLGGDDCTNILGLDFFHAAKTQSAVPPAFRAFQSGRFDTHVPETFNEQSTVTGTSGTGQKEQFVSKVTGIRSNTLSASAAINNLLGLFGIKLSGSTSTTVTSSTADTLSFETTDSSTLGQQSLASSTVSDTSGIEVNGNAYQDLIFQGIAIQDNDMNFPPPGPAATALKAPCGGPGDPRCPQPSLPRIYRKYPIVRTDQTLSAAQRKSLQGPHVEETRYGRVIVIPPAQPSSNRKKQANSVPAPISTAARPHPLDTPPSPPAPTAAYALPVDPLLALQDLNSLDSSNALVAMLLADFQDGMPQLTLNESVKPAGDVGVFDIQLDGAPLVKNVSTTTIGPKTLSIGNHTVGESAGTGTSMSGYKVVLGGDCPAGSVTLTLGDRKTCVILNIGEPPHCATGLTACTNACVDLKSDSQNCGKCGNKCSKDLRCSAGMCSQPACPPGFSICCGGDICSRGKCPICP